MVYFTKYSDQKFEILNKHQVFFRKEQIEEVITAPDKVSKKNKYYYARKEGIKVIYRKEEGVIRVITFFPVK